MSEYDDDEDDTFPFILDSEGCPLDYDEKLAEYRSQLKSCSSSKKKGSWRSKLMDGPRGWMSPRMWKLLMTTAEVASDGDCLDDGHYQSFMPPATRAHVVGFLHVMGKIGATMRSRKLPTTKNVLKKIYGNHESWEYYGPAKQYFESGGRVEHAIDALLRLAQISVDDGEFDEMYPSDDEEPNEDLPVTPFDEDFDLVRIMCLDRGCFDATSPRSVAPTYGSSNRNAYYY